MTQVIYADVLVILNVYVTYILLLLTALISHERGNKLRLVLSAVAGGFCSLFILIPNVSDLLLFAVRIFVSALFLFIAFGKGKLRRFIRLYCTFFAVNFIFAGLMFALWYFAKTGSMYFNSSIVYFDIDSFSLIVLTAVCYCFIRLMSRFIKIKSPTGRIYDVKIFIGEKSVTLKGFLDTGNSLKDPFTGKPVIVADIDSIQELFDYRLSFDMAEDFSRMKIRYIPCSTVSGSELLPCFKADKISVKGVSCDFEIKEMIIGITRAKIKNGEYDILLCDEIFDNKTCERGEDYAQQTNSFI